MTNRQIEKRLRRAMDRRAEDLREKSLAAIGGPAGQRTPKPRFSLRKPFLIAAAIALTAAVLTVGIAGVVREGSNEDPARAGEKNEFSTTPLDGVLSVPFAAVRITEKPTGVVAAVDPYFPAPGEKSHYCCAVSCEVLFLYSGLRESYFYEVFDWPGYRTLYLPCETATELSAGDCLFFRLDRKTGTLIGKVGTKILFSPERDEAGAPIVLRFSGNQLIFDRKELEKVSKGKLAALQDLCETLRAGGEAGSIGERILSRLSFSSGMTAEEIADWFSDLLEARERWWEK